MAKMLSRTFSKYLEYFQFIKGGGGIFIDLTTIPFSDDLIIPSKIIAVICKHGL